MGVKKRLLDLAAAGMRGGVRVAVGRRRASQVLAHLSEQLVPIVEQDAGIGSLKFFCPSHLPEWRARTLMSKEPETLEWIDGFAKTDVLWDVGANVGLYSLYAALRGLTVLSFEPSPGNYYLLSRNVELNGFDDRVSSYCIAFNDNTRLDAFYMSNTELGGALSSFGEATDWKGETFKAKFKQAMVGFSIDEFIKQFAPSFPNHLKIDVDGIEKKIVDGASTTLADKRLKSVLIELNSNLNETGEIIQKMIGHGLSLLKREHAEAYYLDEAKAVYNYIFVRES
jgi:FkbM family methyltransferase